MSQNPIDLKSNFRFPEVIRHKDLSDDRLFLVVDAGPSLAGILINSTDGTHPVYHFPFEDPSDFEKVGEVSAEFALIINKFKEGILMNPSKERAKVELDELNMRIKKLKRFVEGERIATVSPEMADLLKEQLVVMRKYAEILHKRLDIFED